MPIVSGIMSLCQEGRFRLDLDDGRSALFVLHRLARTQPQDLVPLQAAGRRVSVRYDAAPDRVAFVARSVRPEPAP